MAGACLSLTGVIDWGASAIAFPPNIPTRYLGPPLTRRRPQAATLEPYRG